LRDAFQADAETLVDEVIALGEIDAVVALAEAFSTRVFPRAVGLREPDSRKLIDYGAMVFNALGPNNDLRQKSMAKAAEIVPWITDACTRDRLTEDGIGAAIHAAADDGEITEAEAGMLVRSLLSAGIDTTVTAIGNAVRGPKGFCLACFRGNAAPDLSGAGLLPDGKCGDGGCRCADRRGVKDPLRSWRGEP